MSGIPREKFTRVESNEFWAKVEDARILKMWETMSALQIARVLSAEFNTEVSRSAIVGKMHRLRVKYKLKNKGVPRVKKVELAQKENHEARITLWDKPVPVVPLPVKRRARLEPFPAPKSPHKTCQFFVGTKMCGEPSDGSWCVKHKQVVFQQRP